MTRPLWLGALTLWTLLQACGAVSSGEVMTRARPRELAAPQGVILWCARPEGAACEAVSHTLGVDPAEEAALLEALSQPADSALHTCDALTPVLDALALALRLDPANWHENGGRVSHLEALSQTDVGGGCTNCCWDPDEPPVKAQRLEEGPWRVLIRVWESP